MSWSTGASLSPRCQGSGAAKKHGYLLTAPPRADIYPLSPANLNQTQVPLGPEGFSILPRTRTPHQPHLYILPRSLACCPP